MMTKISKRQKLVELCFEQLGLIAAWPLTMSLRLAMNPFTAREFTAQQLFGSMPPLSAMVPVWILAGLWLRLGTRRKDKLTQIVEIVSLAGSVAIVETFFLREFGARISRSFVMLFIPTAFVTVSAMLLGASRTVHFLWERWPPAERVAVVGAGSDAVHILNRLDRAFGGGLQFAGMILPSGVSALALTPAFQVLGRADELAEVINRERLDRIVFAENCMPTSELEQCTRILRQMGLTSDRALAAGLAEDSEVDLARVSGLAMLELRPVFFTQRTEKVKRVLDVMVASVTLVLLLPLLLLIAVAIKLESQGPILYRSRRVGRGGRHFVFLKFRSMADGRDDRGTVRERNEKDGHLFKVKNDPRVTLVGRFIRRYSLDELPQLLNVLRGDMSLVGPRPLPAQDLDPDGQSREFRVWSEHRSRVPPGITGLWQISGRSELAFQRMVELDIAYIRDWSLARDINILLKTPVAVLRGAGAY